MTWLLKLYPPRWRRRYGDEFLALIGPQRFTVGTAMDIIGGAIDAWTQPQSHLAARGAAQPEGETVMLAKMMRLRCAGYGAQTTIADGLKGAGVMIGGTLVSVVLAAWMRRNGIDRAYITAVTTSGWLFAFVLSMPFTSLKAWSRLAQTIFVGAQLVVIAFLVFGAAWLKAH